MVSSSKLMGRMKNRRAERDAWTEFVTGEKAKVNKFNVAPKEERGGFASRHEADLATKYAALESCGQIRDLKMQNRIEVIPADPPFQAVVYIADFTFFDMNGDWHVIDAKGVKTAVYQVKKKALWHLKKIRIEEVAPCTRTKRRRFTARSAGR